LRHTKSGAELRKPGGKSRELMKVDRSRRHGVWD
jgi:hypothetical protein